MHCLTTLCRFCRYFKNIDDSGGLGQAKYDLEAFVKYDIQHSDKYSRKRHARWWPGPSLRTAAVQDSRGWEEANCNAIQEKYDFHKIGKYGMCWANKYCKTTCATEIASVRRQPSAAEEGGIVALFQSPTKLVVAQFWILRAIAEAFPSTYWGSFDCFWWNGAGDLLLRPGHD